MTSRRGAVLGSPIGHSLSPTLHRRAYDVLGLADWTFDAFEVAPAGLADFLTGLDSSWVGLSLTMPLKDAVLPLLDAESDLVRAVGAANTVLLADGPAGQSRRRYGENTDVPGMVAALAGAGIERVARAGVLGAGATARSAVAALGRLGADVTVFARSANRAGELHRTAEALGVRLAVRPWADAAEAFGLPLVVNTSPAGAADPLAGTLARGRRERHGGEGHVGTLFEVLYDPWPTRLARAWALEGGRVVDGLELLVRQAVLQVALMAGQPLDQTGQATLAIELRAAGEQVLRGR